jgi:hypothetical protein
MKRNIWDILAWACIIGIFLWLMLKVSGIINTPVLLEYAPYFGVAYLLGWNVNKLSNISKSVNKLDKFRDATIKEIHDLKLNCIQNHK